MGNVPGGLAIQRTLHSAAGATADGAVLPCNSALDGAKTVAIFQIDGITTATVTFKGRVTAAMPWVAVQATNLADGSEATTATADGIYRVTCIGLSDMIADITAWTTGTIDVVGVACA